ncbi:hypothetical protein MKY04_18095 [Lysinibacillus telephonicus]|uniref:hypothetical protein n=1 Tax=Lysinibacillus telephonicus TaxID=1714840 RepID=UPI0031FC9293
MNISPIQKPDKLLVGIVFNKGTGCHVQTLIGNYSEFLTVIDLLDKKQAYQVVIETENYLMVCLNNCVKTQQEFNKVFDKYFLSSGYKIDLNKTFKTIDIFLNGYTFTGITYEIPSKQEFSRIKREAIKIKYKLQSYYKGYRNKVTNISLPLMNPVLEVGEYLKFVYNNERFSRFVNN